MKKKIEIEELYCDICGQEADGQFRFNAYKNKNDDMTDEVVEELKIIIQTIIKESNNKKCGTDTPFENNENSNKIKQIFNNAKRLVNKIGDKFKKINNNRDDKR
jgi:hypothetical protein